MEQALLNELQGQSIRVLELNICSDTFEMSATMKIMLNDDIYCLNFENVSRMNMEYFSFPLIISGFEIICNNSRGWDSSSKYYVHDFEEETLNFYCEKVGVVLL